MKGIKLSDYFHIVKPTYVFLRLKPNNSIRNNSTDKIAKTISSLYHGITQQIHKVESKLIKVLGKEFLFGTKYRFDQPAKVSYFVYIEKKKAEFYFIVPTQYQSILREKISDSWTGITIEEVKELPIFGDDAIKYQLTYKKEDPLSLSTDKRSNDLLNSNLNVIDVLEEGDRVGIFYNFMPISQFSWPAAYRNTMDKVKRNLPTDRNKFGLSYAFKWGVGTINDIVSSILEGVFGSKKKEVNNNLLETLIERMNGGRKASDSTGRKATATIVNTQIMVISDSDNPIRKHNNARSLAQSFDTIADDNTLISKPYKKEFTPLKFSIGTERNKMGDSEISNFLSLPGRELLEKYNVIDKVETKETEVPEELRNGVMRIGINKYRGTDQEAFLSTDKQYQNLTVVLIGPTRAGKSTLIGNLSHDAIKHNECVVLFDFIANCETSQEVSALFPPDKILNIECKDNKKMQGLGYNEVGISLDPFQQYANAKLQTTQLKTLIDSINSDNTRLTSKMDRFLESASLVVFINGGSIRDVFNVLQIPEIRHQFINNVPAHQMENLQEYISYLQELDKISDGEIVGTKYDKIEGIIDRLNKLKANPYMELMLKKGTENNIDLVEELQKNQLICLRMPETMFSTDGERDIYTTYWLTKLWLSLQIRKQKYPNNMKKVNLFIDELYQVENTEKTLKAILSRLAKFYLKPIISCHYLNQITHIRQELRSANASYMLISGCDKNNFNELKSELYPFEEEDLLKLHRYHSMNLIKVKDGYSRFITKLPPPVSTLPTLSTREQTLIEKEKK
jgi:hypothetical protein